MIFVYGTLKISGGNAKSFDDQRLRVIPGIVWGFRMISLGGYPGAIKDPHHIIKGELHFYNDIVDVLTRMDHIEGYDVLSPKSSLYTREIVTVETERGTYPAYMYIYNGSRRRTDKQYTVKSGEWKNGALI